MHYPSSSFFLWLGMRNFYYDPNVFIEQARAVSTDGLRPSFFTINAAVYVVQVKISAPLFHFSSGKKEL